MSDPRPRARRPARAARRARAHHAMTPLWVCLTIGLGGASCAEAVEQETPPVLPSAPGRARWTIDIGRVLDGVSRRYRPRCLDTVRMGHTVEFRNYNPELPANVTALDSPAGAQALYSPNLVAPYNLVPAEDEDGDSYTYWRYTFEVPGVYDWIDTNSSEPGRKVVDAYYGTVTFVGIDPDSPFGTICVADEGGDGCDGVCCASDDDCSSGQRCFRAEVDAIGRCLTPSG